MAFPRDISLGDGRGLLGGLPDLQGDLLGGNGDAGNGNVPDTGPVNVDNGDEGSTVGIGRDPDDGTVGATGAQVDHDSGRDGNGDLGGDLGDLSADSDVDQGGGNQPGGDVDAATYDSGGALNVTGLSIGGDADQGDGNPAGGDVDLAPDNDPNDTGFDIAASAANGDDRVTGLHLDGDTNTEDGAVKDNGVFLAAIDDSDPDNGADLNIGGEPGTNADDAFLAVHLTDTEVPSDAVPDTGGLPDTAVTDDLPVDTSGPGLDTLLDQAA